MTSLSVPGPLLSLLLGLAVPTSAQDAKICDLKINATPGVPTAGACLDLGKLLSGGTALKTASNTTRIGKDSVTLCPSAFETASAGEADIVFLYDNSASMLPAHAYVNPSVTPPDTQFYWGSLLGCPAASPSGQVTYQTLEGPRTLVKVNASCNREYLAGDPYFARKAAIRQAVDHLYANSKASTVGALAFGSSNDHPRPPLPLADPANVQRLKDTLVLNDLGATWYGPALKQANTWLSDPKLPRARRKAIVLLSDGSPTDSTTYLSAVKPEYPIYGIFLGNEKRPYQRLEDLAIRTGGRFFRVDPKDVSGMHKVMDAIIQAITVRAYPDSIQITNTTLAPPQTSRSRRSDMVVQADGKVTPKLDSILALREGSNTLTIRLFYGDTARRYDLSIQADGPIASGSTRQETCRDNARLVMLNPQGVADASYPPTPTTYSIRLTRTSDDIPAASVSATTEDASRPQPWGDLEPLTLPLSPGAGGVASYSLGNFPFQGNVPSPTPRNGTWEASSPNGKAILGWIHPRDPREFARYELPASPAVRKPTLALVHNGVEISRVTHDQTSLEIHLIQYGASACDSCPVQVSPSGSADRETIVLRPALGYHQGAFTRELSTLPASGDGRLQHLVGDSLVLFYQNPADPGETVRRSYPFDPPPGTLEVNWVNNIANASEAWPQGADAWLLAGPERLMVIPASGSGSCCGKVDWPLTRDDSLRYAGIQVAASDPFSVEMQIFTNFGHPVGKVGFHLSPGEFAKLPLAPGGTTRVLTLLWANRSSEGRLAGTGAYVVRAKATLKDGRLGWSGKRTLGVLRMP